MKNSLILLLIIIGINQNLFAQYSIDTIAADFNNDKIIDTLINEFSSGSSFGGRDVTIINGKTKEEFKLSNYSSYSSFIKEIRLPKNLALKKNSAFLDVLKQKILPKKKETIEASLKWLISRMLSLKQLDSHPLFNLIAQPKTNWQTKPLKIPESYYITISGDTLQKISPIDNDNPITKTTQGLLIYWTSGYYIEQIDSLTPVAKNKNYQIFKTPHAVFAKKGDAYKWLFISDASVMGAPDKHRWFSIKQVQLIDKYLIIHQDVPPDNIYNIQIINIETQKVGRLNFEPSFNNWSDKKGMNTFKIIDNQLLFTEYGEPEIRKIALTKIFNALDSYTID